MRSEIVTLKRNPSLWKSIGAMQDILTSYHNFEAAYLEEPSYEAFYGPCYFEPHLTRTHSDESIFWRTTEETSTLVKSLKASLDGLKDTGFGSLEDLTDSGTADMFGKKFRRNGLGNFSASWRSWIKSESFY